MRNFFFCLLFCASAATAQEYSVASIPDSLKTGADAVIRYQELNIQLRPPAKAIVQRTIVATILNEKASALGVLQVYYSKFHDVNDIDGTLYDANGKKLKSVKKKDIVDFGGMGDGSLIDDARMKLFSFPETGYPYTVKFVVELEYKGLFSLPRWTPVALEDVGIMESKLVVSAPATYLVRYQQYNSKPPQVTEDGSNKVYQWQVSGIKPLKDELLSPDWEDVFPTVLVAPSDFEYGGYAGNMNSWLAMGKFIADLYAGRNELPENVRSDIHRLTDGLSDPQQKIQVLYDYLQKNTRYISIQLGIGGFQPFKASEVAVKKYGDCKGLSNYMVSMLNEAGIKAYPVIIEGGDDAHPVYEEFPSNQFNHVVACVPGADTTWLECTSQTVSAGFMGSFTGNRKGLLIKDDGGYLVATPRYSAGDNLQLRKIIATVDAEGHVKADIRTHFTGEQEEGVAAYIHVFTPEQKQKRLNERINLPSYKVEESAYTETKGKIPSIDERLLITAPNYASITGKRLFIVPNFVNKQGYKLPADKPRQFPVQFRSSWRDIDTIEITIPQGYELEAGARDVSLSSKCGKYSVTYKVNGNLITVIRMSERYAGIYLTADYDAMAKYFEEMYKADRNKLVFVKKE